MDITETYIKMRVAAIPELGMGIPPTKSPPYFHDNKVWTDDAGNWYAIYHQGEEDAVIGCQLERQDQLQAMVHPEVADWVKAVMFSDSLRDYRDNGWSMEQLWLAFMMKENCGKRWDGSAWLNKTIILDSYEEAVNANLL